MLPFLSKLFKKPSFYFVAILGLAYFLIGFYNLNNIGLAGDETAHLGAAHSYITGHGVNVEHPTLLKNLNAGVIAIFFPEFESKDNDQWRLGVNFLLDSPANSSQILFYSRVVYLVFNSLFLLALWFYTYKIKFLSPKFSWLMGVFYVFSPSFFSHNFLITFDVAGSWSSFMVMVSIAYFCSKFATIKLQNIPKTSLLPSIFLALALNLKFSNFLWVAILGLLFSVFYIWFYRSKNWLQLAKLRSTFITFTSVNLIFIWLNNFIAYRDRFESFILFERFKIFQPLYIYLKGFVMTIGRSDHIQPNFIDDKSVVITYSNFINRVFWFKENPILLLSILISCGLIVFWTLQHRDLFDKILKQKPVTILKNNWIILLIVAFPVMYLASSFNSKLTIGYRHFYPFLIYLYALLAFIISRVNFKYNQIFVTILIFGYAIFGVLAVSSGLTYTNNFWSRPKWQLIRDSTIYWGESETKGFRYLKQNNLFKSSDSNILSGKDWNLALANGAGPNTNIALQEIIGKGNLLDNFWTPFVDIHKVKFVDLKQEYLVADINTIQELSDRSHTNEVSKINLEYLLQTKPIYSQNQAFFIYKLQP